MKIKTDTQIAFDLPREVRCGDYHDFAHMQEDFEAMTGVKRVMVTEVGFDYLTGEYVGLVHTNTKAHQALLDKMREELEEYEE